MSKELFRVYSEMHSKKDWTLANIYEEGELSQTAGADHKISAFCWQLLCHNNQEIFTIHKTSIALQTKFLKLGVHTEYNSEH